MELSLGFLCELAFLLIGKRKALATVNTHTDLSRGVLPKILMVGLIRGNRGNGDGGGRAAGRGEEGEGRACKRAC